MTDDGNLMAGATAVMSPAVLALAFIAVLAVATWVFWSHKHQYDKRLVNYFTIISSLALATAFFTVVLQQRQAQVQNSARQKDRLAEQQRSGYVGIQRLLTDQLPDSFELIRQLNTANSVLQSLPQPPVSNASVACAKQALICHVIFERMESVYLTLGGVSIDWSKPYSASWLRVWRIWFRSPLLRQVWISSKQRFSVYLQQFVSEMLWPEQN